MTSPGSPGGGESTTSSPTVAITGANGFLGRHLCRHFASHEWSVRALVRDPSQFALGGPNIAPFHCSLPNDIDAKAFAGVRALIHCAYATQTTSPAEARLVNEEGTARVLALARASHVPRFVFVSSTSAHEGALSYYGQSKLAVEQQLDAGRDLILRPGLVLGRDGGLFVRLSAALKRFGVIPLFGGGGRPLQTVHVDDLCLAAARAIERGLVGRLVVAEPDALSTSELFRLVARKMGRRCFLIPIPVRPALLALGLSERLGLGLPLTSENVLGSLSLTYQPSQRDLDTIGIKLRNASESLDDLLAGDGH